MARRLPRLLAAATAGVALGLGGTALATAPPASAADPDVSATVASSTSSWIDTVSWYRAMAHLGPVVEDPEWSAGLAQHLAYLHDTPTSFKSGAYASAHTENPASPAYTAAGAAAGRSADIYFGT